jgi:hypothetical protein
VKKQLHDENGMVSITITIILILVVSITVLSFAQIIRREQREALDNQLSNQAYYAAESGINDAKSYVTSKFLNAGLDVKDKTNCGEQLPDYPLSASGIPMTVDSETGSSYTCLLISGAPKTLQYDLSTSSPSRVFPIDARGNTISNLTFSWTPTATTTPLAGCPTTVSQNLQQDSATDKWPCTGYGIIRLDLVPVYSVFTLSRDAFQKYTFTAFLTPTAVSGTGLVSYTTSVGANNVYGTNVNQGVRPAARCDAVNCKITLNGLPAAPISYYARVSTLYRDTKLDISAIGTGNQSLSLYGAQVVIDSTGKAQDVLRRVQVRVPLNSNGLHSDYGVESNDSICKQFTVYNNPGDPSNDSSPYLNNVGCVY